MKRVMVFGATSAIVKAFASELANHEEKSCWLFIGRNQETLTADAHDLSIREGVDVKTLTLDFLDFSGHESFFQKGINLLGGLDVLIMGQGSLTNQKAAEKDILLMKNEFDLNFMSYATFLSLAANHMEKQKSGHIIAISSVAGERGRQSNYIYGASKASLSVFLSGLRNRCTPLGIQVMTVKPGFVDTPMTKDFKKSGLWATPNQVAKDILKGYVKGKDVVFTPFFWRYIMLIIIHIPEKIFKKLKL